MIAWLGVALAGVVGDGAAAFEEGDLDRAIAAWEAAGADGAQRSGVVEYDLGVAYWRKGDLPRSIARLRAAERLRPRDGHVQHNLALARSGLEGVPVPVGPAAVWMQVLAPGEVGLLGLFVTLLGSTVLVAGARSARWRARGAVVLGVGLLLGGLGAWGVAEHGAHPVAVVVDQDAVLRDGASVGAGERFRLSPGAEVRVVRSAGDFLLVEDGRGRRGWAARSAVDVTAP